MRTSDGAPRVVIGLVVVLLTLLAGCSGGSPADIPSGQSSDGAATQGPVVEARSPDAARSKLRLALADPCYASPDARAVWPRCGRWVEEAAGIARTAASALPNDAAVTGAVPAVAAAHDDFVGRGCPSTGPAVPLDANACVGALTSVRTAVGRLSAALGQAS
ncbi:hypothetical protein LQ327_08340 [Actinomycetospora endophytica]|uniref:Uncharacterized protein n=1 Tax=Actinomycetospora endophytica TaxID=2291215 RepID=A0ABS8P5U3_9PSEU|nr:hypothetical protein [Actinomycetospora endophytica]MCD2193393.1 hypothetical protein [Actinomycetospora endophytica]